MMIEIMRGEDGEREEEGMEGLHCRQRWVLAFGICNLSDSGLAISRSSGDPNENVRNSPRSPSPQNDEYDKYDEHDEYDEISKNEEYDNTTTGFARLLSIARTFLFLLKLC